MPREEQGSTMIPVAMLGLSSAEAIPLYHYTPGGVILRIALAGHAGTLFECEGFPICVFGDGSRLALMPVDTSLILYKARQWRVDAVFLDGLEPLNSLGEDELLDLIEAFKRHGFRVGARTLGLSSPSVVERLDFAVIDYMKDYSVDPAVPGEAIRLIYDLLEVEKPWIEVSAYIKEPSFWRLHPLVLALSGSERPVHVFIEDHKGGGPLRDLYEELKRRMPYVYIHNDLYSRLDTYCPRCKAPIASRDEGVLRALEVLDDERCWKCGYKLAFRGRIRKKTPEQLLLSTEGGVKWFHPSQLVGGLAR